MQRSPPALDLSTSGKTEAQAKRRFEEIVNIFFDDLIEKNKVAEVLTELGWRKARQWQPPKVVNKSVSIKVPELA